MRNTMESITINQKIITKLKEKGYGDRLGRFVEIQVIDVPNHEYVMKSALEVISAIYFMMGYGRFTYEEIRKFPEFGESWIHLERSERAEKELEKWVQNNRAKHKKRPIFEDVIRIIHKYWTLEKCMFFKKTLKNYALLHKGLSVVVKEE